MHNDIQYTWHFHGNDIRWRSEKIRFHYNLFPLNAFNVAFTSSTIRDFIQQHQIDFTSDPHELETLFSDLTRRKLLVKLLKEYEIYALL